MTRVDSVPFSSAETQKRWSELEAESDLSSAYAQTAFIKAMAAQADVDAQALFVEEGGQDVAAVIAYERLALGLRRILPVPFSSFCPLIARSLPTDSQIHSRSNWMEVLTRELGSTFDTVDLMLPPDVNDVRAFQWNGWTTTPLYTFHVPVGPIQAAISSWSDSAARNFKKHRDSFEFLEDPHEITSVVQLCENSYTRHARKLPLEISRTVQLATDLHSNGVVKCCILRSRDTGDIRAGILVLFHRNTVVYWMAGSHPGPEMTVLIGELLARLSDEDGALILDFAGANTPGIAEFKRKFAPDLIPYYRVRFTRNRALRFLQTATQVFRRSSG